jgi:hypothetical protein
MMQKGNICMTLFAHKICTKLFVKISCFSSQTLPFSILFLNLDLIKGTIN